MRGMIAPQPDHQQLPPPSDSQQPSLEQSLHVPPGSNAGNRISGGHHFALFDLLLAKRQDFEQRQPLQHFGSVCLDVGEGFGLAGVVHGFNVFLILSRRKAGRNAGAGRSTSATR